MKQSVVLGKRRTTRGGQGNRIWAVAGRKPPTKARFHPGSAPNRPDRDLSQRQEAKPADTETYFVLMRLPCVAAL